MQEALRDPILIQPDGLAAEGSAPVVCVILFRGPTYLDREGDGLWPGTHSVLMSKAKSEPLDRQRRRPRSAPPARGRTIHFVSGTIVA
jgi:hypothetical protein